MGADLGLDVGRDIPAIAEIAMELYQDLNELISIAFNALDKVPDADMDFVESVQWQYRAKGTLSPKQIQALENIGHKELWRRREMGNMQPLF